MRLRPKVRPMNAAEERRWMGRHLREAACEWAEHIHDEPTDMNDSACRRRWQRLARAAYEYARASGRLPWVKESAK